MLQGKGFYTWKIPNCEGGNPANFAAAAKAAGLTHVLLKIADGVTTYNGTWGATVDWVTPVVQALRGQGIQVWGWQYVYGNDPIGEANLAIRRCQQFQVDGFAIDAEKEYKEDGKAEAARRYMAQLRAGLPNTPLALSSYRFPSLHPQLPWKPFLDKCDINMPQVYWMQSHNAGAQLQRCQKEFAAIIPNRPLIPTGAAFREGGWQPTVGEVNEFLSTAVSMNLSAANFWVWDDARMGILPGIWEAIAQFNYGGTPQTQDICQRLVAQWNTRDAGQVIQLYTPTAVHTTSTRTVAGSEAIRAWYDTLFKQTLPNAIFTLTGYSGSGGSRTFTWTATSSAGKVLNGKDTLGVINDKISYHTQGFTVTK